MQNDHPQLTVPLTKSVSAYQNQNANAVAIDSMLANLKLLLKKTLLMRKTLKEVSERKDPFLEKQHQEKMDFINEETKNLLLIFDKTIPPDKRMTNLFYMRMMKEIACYEKIVPSFSEIKPKLEHCYSQQVTTEQFSILEMYLLCERKFVLEIKLLKNKAIQTLKEHTVITSNTALVNNAESSSTLLTEKKSFVGKICLTEQTNEEKKNVLNFNRIFDGNYNLFLKQPVQKPPVPKTPKKCHKNLSEAIEKASKTELNLDFKQRATQLFDKIYNALDIESNEVITYFIPTLMPEDNIDFIYQKVKGRNKRNRKDVREFQTEHALFLLRREDNNRRKLRREESRKRTDSIVKEQRMTLKILERGSPEIQRERARLFEERKCSLPAVDIMKGRENFQPRERAVSRLRERFEQSMEHTKDSTIAVMKFNSPNQHIINEPKISISAKNKKKKIFDESTVSEKDKENNSLANEAKVMKRGASMNKTEKTESKASRFGEKRGRSLKNRSNKEIISKKLKL